MSCRVCCLVACFGVWGSSAVAQSERGPFVDEMRAAVEKSKGDNLDRCSLGFQVGDNGRVLLSFQNDAVLPGDVVKSANGVSLEGKTAEDFSDFLRTIGATASIPVVVARQGTTSIQQMQCSSARATAGVLAQAREAAARKKFKDCVAALQQLPTGLRGHWYYQYVMLNCATHAGALSKESEVSGVYRWADALIAEAEFVRSEREQSAKAVQSLAGYFNRNARPDLHERLTSALGRMYAAVGEEKPPQPAWGKFRQTAEREVRSRLIDPSSAQFEWPFGFIYGTWKPFLGRRVEGYWTCGRVNARNRMGGYVGSTAFVVVMGDEKSVTFVDVGSGKDFDITEAQCSKSASLLPPAPPELLAATPVNSPAVSVADELEKLAALRDKGILTEAEFQAQKAALLTKEQD